MAVQHKDIADEDRHEPKGITLASSGTVYVSNGAGGGDWREVDIPVLSGLSGDNGSNNKKLVSNGANGFRLVSDASYIQMGIAGNAAPFSIGVAASPTLDISSEYISLTGAGAPWEGGLSSEAGFSVNKAAITVAGVYRLSMTVTVSGFPTTTAKVGFKLKTSNGNTPFVRRKAVLQSSGTASSEQGFIEELVNLSAGDDVSVYVASTAEGTITVQDLSLIVQLIKAT